MADVLLGLARLALSAFALLALLGLGGTALLWLEAVRWRRAKSERAPGRGGYR